MQKGTLYILCMIFCVCVQAQRIDNSVLATLEKVPSFMLFGKRSNRIVLSLETLHVKDEVFWFRFSIRNKSVLSYPVELFRLYIQDRSHAARTSQQEIELIPVYADTLTVVPANKTVRFFIALNKFTIPDNRICLLEMFERSGGRNLSLEISNRQLFLARPVLLSNPKKEK